MSITDKLKADLLSAMRQGDQLGVTTIRTLMSAIDNAGAVDVESHGSDSHPKVGLGHDVDRREVTDDDIRRIIIAERDDLVAARDEYRRLGEVERAEELDQRAEIVSTYVV